MFNVDHLQSACLMWFKLVRSFKITPKEMAVQLPSLLVLAYTFSVYSFFSKYYSLTRLMIYQGRRY